MLVVEGVGAATNEPYNRTTVHSPWKMNPQTNTAIFSCVPLVSGHPYLFRFHN